MPLHSVGLVTRRSLLHPEDKLQTPRNYELVQKEHKCWGHDCGKGGGAEPKKKVYSGDKVIGAAGKSRRLTDEEAKAAGLKPGKYSNVKGVGVMGHSHEDLRKEPARNASLNADVSSSTIARDKKKDIPSEHDRAAKHHREAATEHEKLGNTKEAEHHRAKAKEHYERSKALRSASKFELALKGNPYHDKATGRFTSGRGGSRAGTTPLSPDETKAFFKAFDAETAENNAGKNAEDLDDARQNFLRPEHPNYAPRPGAISVPQKFLLSEAEKQRNYREMFGQGDIPVAPIPNPHNIPGLETADQHGPYKQALNPAAMSIRRSRR